MPKLNKDQQDFERFAESYHMMKYKKLSTAQKDLAMSKYVDRRVLHYKSKLVTNLSY